MKVDFRTVFVKMHAHLQMQERVKNGAFAEVANTAKSHRLLLESLVQQALVTEFLDESAKVQGTDGPSLMKDLLRGTHTPEDDIDA